MANKFKKRTVLIPLAIIVVLILIFSPRKPSRIDDKLTTYAMAQHFIVPELKSPASAKFPSSTNAGVIIVDNGNGDHSIIGFVDSQNSFGANIRTKYHIVLKYYPASDRWEKVSLVFSQK